MLFAELPDLIVDLVQDFAGFFKPFFLRAVEFGRIRERPVQTSRYSRKNRTPCRLRLVANRDDIGEQPPCFEDVEYRLSVVLRNVDPNFPKHFHRERIQFPRFQSGTLGIEEIGATLVQQRRRHLAARAIVNTNEQDFPFHNVLAAHSLSMNSPVFMAQKCLTVPLRRNILLRVRSDKQ
jgi:hypothetical protein